MQQSELETQQRLKRLEDAVLDDDDTGNSILDGNIKEVKATLSEQTDEELVDLRAAEVEGKNRAGVLDAIDAEIEGRQTAE